MSAAATVERAVRHVLADATLPDGRRADVIVEAGVTLGWQKYVGDRGGSIGVDRYGASAPGDVVMREYGFTVDHVVDFARGLLRKEGGES